MHRLFIGGLLALCLPLGVAHAAITETTAPSQEGATAPAETLATGVDENARITVPVTINGKGPYHFIVDTGAERSLIAREVATELALPVAGKSTLISLAATSEVTRVRVDQLAVSEQRSLRNVALPTVPRRYLGADGLLGLDALKGQRILIDFSAGTMLVEPGRAKARRPVDLDPRVIVVQGRTMYGQLVLVDADVAGEPIWVALDTGGQSSMGNDAFRRLMSRGAPSSPILPVDLIGVVGDRVAAEYVKVGKMRVGHVEFGNAAVAFSDARLFRQFGLHRKPALFLGMESLRSFRTVSIDFAAREVRFQLPENALVATSR